MKFMNRTLKFLIAILFFLLIWQLVAVLINNIFFPTPPKVISGLYLLFQNGMIYIHIWASLKRTIIGFIFALIIGSFLGYLVGMSSFLRNYVTPVIELLRPIPPIAWTPLAILWLGIGDASSSFIIFVAAFFPIFTNVCFGVTSLPLVYHRVSKNYNLNPFQKFTNIIFPFSFPYLITGCKTSLGFGWMAVIAAEMIAGNYGLGYFIEVNRVLLKTELVIATMIIIAVIGYLMNQLVTLLESKVTSWRIK